MEEIVKTNKKVRLLYHLGSGFIEFELSAMQDDAKVGLKYFSAWEKIALVSDHELINSFMKFFGHMMHGDVRIFKDAELAEAKSWIIE